MKRERVLNWMAALTLAACAGICIPAAVWMFQHGAWVTCACISAVGAMAVYCAIVIGKGVE